MNTKRQVIHDIVFEADTKAGKFFDIALLILIVISVTAVILESVESIYVKYGLLLRIIEWTITVIFTIEYFLRIFIVKRPLAYIRSFFGIIDLLSILPSYFGLFLFNTRSLLVIRSLRLLRVFRILKLSRYVKESTILIMALKASRTKIFVFLYFVLTSVIIIGTTMYLIEGKENGFESIPQSIYWSIVTLTTVGYGDIAPQTDVGRFLASLVMILGYAVIAVPTGIVSVEISNSTKKAVATQVCPNCLAEGHDIDAKYCKYCSAEINSENK